MMHPSLTVVRHAIVCSVASLCVLILGCGSGATPSAATTSGTGSLTPTWTQLTGLPAAMTANGAILTSGSDGYLYSEAHIGASGAINVFRTLASSPTTWTDLSGTGLPIAAPLTIGLTPNGTVLLNTSTGPGNADVYSWNGSTTSPLWSKVTGWNGVSSNTIYSFANDSAGYTYFSPAWSGDIWRNDTPNSLHFTKVISNLYAITGGGATGHATTGGLYALQIWNLGDGKGDMIWTCGEGELDNIALTGSAASNTAYLTTAKGYTGNCTTIEKSATTILSIRVANTALDTLNSINIATRTATVHPSTAVRSATSFPNNTGIFEAGVIHWMAGTNFILSAYANGGAPTYLLLSQDDGTTWTDITASGAINSTCTGANLSVGSVVTSHYIFARCQDGRAIWQYGPI